MSVLRRLPLLALPLMITACNASEAKVEQTSTAVEAASTQAVDTAALTKRFEKIGIKVEKIVPSDIDGLLEIQTNSGIIFSSPKGDHFLAGTLYSLDDNGKFSDVLAERQAPLNAEKVAALSDTVIEYKADNEKYVVTVFTDITCGYCVRLHSQMQGYNDLGITVRYMAYPRQGATGQVADQMAAIWASDDPKAAMHSAKAERKMPAAGKDLSEQKQIIAKQYQLGRELGINGTPAIVLASGELVSGYLPPAQLLQRLEQ
ncbi:thiol:disulfide interchange protein [Vibrio lentus]|uniref:Thiol:disulfide interchange protein n=1 Tax=Vibrio lentus TaxID=136468 RepID=A0A2J6VVZ8_9VIBR|nr:thioredoxin fold domain-containing protein [Vibrio lentus]PMM72287.1 thiol:disulfide interchange protein [Vibrio lentus]PMN52430.1 thiol:disulfide interchange protein [Vibrio lentus]